MRVFISLPMRDRTDEEIIEEMDDIFQEFKARYPEAKMIKSFFNRKEEADTASLLKHPPVYYLSLSLAALADADIIIMGRGWEKAPGCRIEFKVARYYDIPVEYAR